MKFTSLSILSRLSAILLVVSFRLFISFASNFSTPNLSAFLARRLSSRIPSIFRPIARSSPYSLFLTCVSSSALTLPEAAELYRASTLSASFCIPLVPLPANSCRASLAARTATSSERFIVIASVI